MRSARPTSSLASDEVGVIMMSDSRVQGVEFQRVIFAAFHRLSCGWPAVPLPPGCRKLVRGP
jgi:hypothetical protein